MLDSKRSNSERAVPEAMQVLDELKNEVATEIGIQLPDDGYWGNMTSRQCGNVGGHMVKKLIEVAENELIGKM